jgi:hypothetical protein
MVVKDGVVYFPSELYPAYGITPFSTAPRVDLPRMEPPVLADAESTELSSHKNPTAPE